MGHLTNSLQKNSLQKESARKPCLKETKAAGAPQQSM